MKGKIISTLFILVLIVLSDLIFFKLSLYSLHPVRLSMIHFVINSLLLFILFENLLYKGFFTLQSKKIVIVFYLAIPLMLAMHLSDRLITINTSYLHVKNDPVRIGSNIWQPDPLFGHRGIPNVKGEYEYYIGDSIKGSVPVYLNATGFRTVAPSSIVKSDSTDLYLGCSYTFGDYIEAKNSYSSLTSGMLGHSYVNAGASAYGYAQMMQLADRLTKDQKFNYVFIQLSPWLAERSMFLKSTTSFGYKPYPYFSDSGNSFKLNPIAFHNMKPSGRNWHITPVSYMEKVQFTFTDGMGSEICDYYAYKWARLKTLLGIIPTPTNKKEDLEKFFYTHVINTCRQNNAIPVIIKLEYPREKHMEMLNYLEGKAIIIDLDHNLEKKVIETGLPYDKVKEITNYEKTKSIYHIAGKDSIIYDSHPNEATNRSYAETIYNVLRGR